MNRKTLGSWIIDDFTECNPGGLLLRYEPGKCTSLRVRRTKEHSPLIVDSAWTKHDKSGLDDVGDFEMHP